MGAHGAELTRPLNAILNGFSGRFGPAVVALIQASMRVEVDSRVRTLTLSFQVSCANPAEAAEMQSYLGQLFQMAASNGMF